MVHGEGRVREMKDEKGNHGPRGERKGSGEKGGGVMESEVEVERALVVNSAWGRWACGAGSGSCWC